MLTLAGEPCPCGRPLGLVSAIEGRSDDMLYLPGPAGRAVAVHPIQVRSALAARADIRQYQVIHDQQGLHVLVVLRNGASGEACRAAVARNLGESLTKLRVEPPSIDVQVVDSIPREGGQAAKFKLVRSLLGGPAGVAKTASEPGGTR
jgi:phenylacetate-coenzyme A ligase PaaK-like adenylate-forming protein